MSDDPDALLLDIVRRLAQVRSEMGPGSFARAVHATRGAIGAVVMAEAERRARLRNRRQPLPADADVIPLTAWRRSRPRNEAG